jgi:lipoprotein-releasing system permease protein
MVARDLGDLQVGDKVDVKIVDRWGNDKIKQFTVSDIAFIYGAFGFDTYIHIDTLREMLDREGQTEAILVKLHNEKDIQGFKKFLGNYLKSDRYEIQDVEEAGEDILTRVRSGISMIEPIGYFSLTSSSFIIFAIQSMFITTITHKIGIIRALGVKRMDIVGIFFIQAIIIGAIGVCLGTLSGIGFAILMDNAQFRFGDDVSIPLEINYNLNKIVLTALAAFFLSIIGALIPAFFAARISPLEAMRK